MLGHAVERACDYYLTDRSLFIFIYSFHMPAFLFISGLFAKRTIHSEKYPWKKLLPYVLVTLVLGFYRDLSIRLRNPNHGFSFYDQNKISWFMLALFACYSIAWLLRNVSWKVVLPASFLVGLAIGYVPFISEGFALSRIIVFFPFFYAGSVTDRDRFAMYLDKKPMRAAGGSVLLLWFVLCFVLIKKVYLLRRLFTGQNNYDEIPGALGSVEFLYRLLAYAISALAILAFLALVPRKPVPHMTELGARTLGVYFWHLPVLDVILHTNWAVSLMKTNVGLQLLLAVSLSVLLTYVFSWKPFQTAVSKLLDPWPLFERKQS